MGKGPYKKLMFKPEKTKKTTKALTPKQAQFVKEFLVDLVDVHTGHGFGVFRP